MSLLPPNASSLEKALCAAIKHNFDCDRLRGFKFNPGNSVLPWLILEYGLAEVFALLPDPRVLKEGIAFQCIRGTPKALKIALEWLSIKDAYIEEEPPGVHFAEFQIGVQDVLDDFIIGKIVALAKIASPVRAHLTRLYNKDYDVRRFILSESTWGDLLSDYSGVRFNQGPILSFGRINKSRGFLPKIILKTIKARDIFLSILTDDIYRLSAAFLSDTLAVQNYRTTYLRDHYAQATFLFSPKWNAIYSETLKQFFREHSKRLLAVTEVKSKTFRQKEVCAYQRFKAKVRHYLDNERFSRAIYLGVITWHQHRHLKRSWRDSNPIVNITSKENGHFN